MTVARRPDDGARSRRNERWGFENVGRDDYLLGHDDAELRRLQDQAHVLGPATRAILTLAGIEHGMRVLDLGSGAGDVAFDVAAIVGAEGSVLGIDRSPRAVARAAERARERGLTHVSFIDGDLTTVDVAGSFDAVVGRLVLLYTSDPALVLKRYAALVRPGGVVVAMEYEMTSAGSLPRREFTDRVVTWITSAFTAAGLDPLLGARLKRVMRDAGLEPSSTLGFQPYLDPDDPAGARMVAEVVRTLLPAIVASRIASDVEVGIDTLEARIADSHSSTGALLKPPALVGCWARVP